MPWVGISVWVIARVVGGGQGMGEVRAKNTGTFDRTTNTWRIKGRKIQASIRQLSKRYGVDLPRGDKRASLPYWRRYVQEVQEQAQEARKASSPLQTRIKSLDSLLAHAKAQGKPTGDLEALLAEAIAVPPHDIDFADVSVLSPEIASLIPGQLNGLSELEIRQLNNLVIAPARQSGGNPIATVKARAEAMVARLKAKPSRNTFYFAQNCLELFQSITGNIPVQEINVAHYEAYLRKIASYPTWSDITKHAALNTLKTFLRGIEADIPGCSFGFVKNKLYDRRKPEGQKIQYTEEQLRIALAHATGRARMGLLLGMNCGFIWSDMVTLKPEHLQGNYMIRIRQKNATKTDLCGQWRLWSETKQHIQFGLSHFQLEDAFRKLRKEHSLPIHKAIRKGIVQIIQDEIGEDAARLYRCENVSGTHGRNYVRSYTPPQVERLDAALAHVARKFNLEAW
jgi:hypothetical protein